MSGVTTTSERVRATCNEVLGALSMLADELSTARNPSLDHRADVAGAGRHLLTVSVALAMALVDWLPEFELEYGDLDVVIGSIARRLPDSEASATASELFSELFRALRELSYDAPRGDFPDAEDCNGALEVFIEELLDRAGDDVGE